jgi:hypothetical protein
MPKTALGKWSVGLIVATALSLFVGASLTNVLYQSVPAGNSIMEDIARRPALALAMLAGMAAGISACVTGLYAVIRRKERSILVYAATIIGALLLVFLIGELLFPH